MAQTKTNPKSSKSKSRSSTSSNGASASRGKAKSTRKASASRSKNGASASVKGKASGASASGKEKVSDGAQGVAKGIGPIAEKAKVPLLATGAAAAGIAGAVVASRKGKSRKVLGMRMPKGNFMPKANGFKPDAQKMSGAVVDAAKKADKLGQRISRVAGAVQDIGDASQKAVKKT